MVLPLRVSESGLNVPSDLHSPRTEGPSPCYEHNLFLWNVKTTKVDPRSYPCCPNPTMTQRSYERILFLHSVLVCSNTLPPHPSYDLKSLSKSMKNPSHHSKFPTLGLTQD